MSLASKISHRDKESLQNPFTKSWPLRRMDSAVNDFAEHLETTMTLEAKAAEQIQTLSNDVIAALANGLLDVNVLLRAELASRGLNLAGTWVGFAQARTELLGK